MQTVIIVIHLLIVLTMIGLVLLQKSEGGGLGVGGSPTGLLSARGVGDFMTRATTILACLFVGLSIALAAMASVGGAGGSTIDTSLSKTAQPQGGGAPSSLTAPAQPATQGAAAPAAPAVASDDPLAAAAAAAAAQDAPAPAKK